MHRDATDLPLTIEALIASHAQRAPESSAISSPGRAHLTYGRLQAAVTEVSQALRQGGVGRADRVALALPNGPELAVAVLGVACAATCAPLNPSYREDDFDFGFGDLGVRAVIVPADSPSAAIAAARRRSVAIIEMLPQAEGPAGTFRLRVPAVSAEARPHQVQPDDTALVLHTSGTTAKPKIVPLTHLNLCASAHAIRQTLDLTPADVSLNIMPLFHVHGLVGALLASIAAGASVVCTAAFRGGAFLDWLHESGATWYTAVPTLHAAVLEAAAAQRRRLEAPRLRFVRSSSMSLPPSLLDALSSLFAVPIIEAYGMTEASHQIASNPLRRGAQRAGSVGQPAGPEVGIMDVAGRLLATGEIGEVVIRGDTVTRGYEGSPQANREAFVGQWFRTGDQGYFDGDGYLHLTGRLKELINRGGEKIAPREVEEALLQHPSVAQAVAFALPHPRLGEEVAAAVVLRRGEQTTASEIGDVAAARLPSFKIPRVLRIVESIPNGATGKVQRGALAEMLGLTRFAPQSEPPRTPRERALAAEWARLLQIDRVGIDDDFFALGGDSLVATEMIIRAEALLGVEIPVAEFVERPTIAGLIYLREQALADCRRTGVDDLVVIRQRGDRIPLFCPAPHDNSFWRLSRLLRHLAGDRPVYGLRPPTIGERGPLYTIERLAARNLEIMLAMCPEGPHYIVGPCFGGVVAFEMARQLERRRRPAALLVMIDTFNQSWSHKLSMGLVARVRARHAADRASHLGERLLRERGRARRDYLRDRAVLFAERWSTAVQHRRFELVTRLGLPRPAALQDVAYANHWAQKRYRPGPYAGDVLMVCATVPIAGVYPVPHMGWGELLRGKVVLLDRHCEKRDLWSDESFLQEIAGAISDRIA